MRAHPKRTPPKATNRPMRIAGQDRPGVPSGFLSMRPMTASTGIWAFGRAILFAGEVIYKTAPGSHGGLNPMDRRDGYPGFFIPHPSTETVARLLPQHRFVCREQNTMIPKRCSTPPSCESSTLPTAKEDLVLESGRVRRRDRPLLNRCEYWG